MAQIKKDENVRRLSDLFKKIPTPPGVVFCPYIPWVLQPDPITGSPHLHLGTKDNYDFLKNLLSGKAKGKIVKWQN